MKTNVQQPEQLFNQLFEVILSLETKEECAEFFKDMCTKGEIDSMAQRLELFLLLKEGKTYAEISELTHVSSTTISRASRIISDSESINTIIDRIDR